VLAVDRVCVLVVDPARHERMLVAVAEGMDERVIGDRIGSPDELLGAGSGAAMRIGGPDGVAGVLYVVKGDRARRFQRFDRRLLADMATLFAAALDDARMGAALGPKVRACLDELARLAEAPESAALHVGATARRIGVRFGLDEAALVELELAARLSELRGAHGALALTPGFEAVGLVLRLADERWDGGGGPYGLAARRIPLASRILAACRALADATEATEFDALRRVHASSGRAFDPGVVGALWRDFCDRVTS
jgi:HD-GYP domain-containing protein (c-di-GMP phosphodiesterase class II)